MKLQKHPISRQLFNSQTLKRITLAFLPMSFLLCAGCSDEFESVIPTSGEQIEFAVSTSSGWSSPTRSRATDAMQSLPRDTCYTMQSQCGGKKMYLHTRTERNTGNPFADNITPASRGMLKDMSDYDSFGLFAGIYDGDTWDEDNCSVNYISDEECRRTSGNSFSTSQQFFWPGQGQNIHFFAYAPYGDSNITISTPENGSPTLTYTVPEDNGKQLDIFVWDSDKSLEGDKQKVMFNHALTAIQFIGDKGTKGSIKSIAIRNVYSKASAKIESDVVWENYLSSGDFVLTFDESIVIGDETVDLAVDNNTFFMLPQVLPEEASIEIDFAEEHSGLNIILNANIGGSEWKSGSMVTYYVSASSIKEDHCFVISGSSSKYNSEDRALVFPFSAVAQSEELDIQSYSTYTTANGSSTYIWEEYTYQLIETEEEENEVIQKEFPYLTVNSKASFHPEGPTQTMPESNKLSVEVMTKYGLIIEENSYDEVLQEASIVNNVNLAEIDGKETTANCYMVSAPGSYKFPLVYGNALVGGSENTKAYTNQKPSSNTFLNYPNYKGNPITKAHILEDNDVVQIGVGNPILLWQDQKGLIQDVLLHDGYIEFNVPQKNIREGNALIAICDNNGDIIWSWHIWITIPKTDIVVKSDKFMGSYIGYCHPHEQYYPERNVTLRITQVRTGHFEDISLKLSKGVIPDVGNSVLYQWGRKDPLPGLVLDMVDKDSNTEIGSLNKSVYSIDNSTINIPTVINRRISIAESILYPTAQAATSSNATIWHELLSGNEDAWYTNLWDAKETGSSASTIEKTIYDPSPVGYSILSPRIVSYFKSAVTNINEDTSLNYNVTINETLVSFPFTLRRDYTGDYDEEFRMTDFYIWGSPNQSYSMLHPISFGESGAYVAKWPLKNVALPVLPMRQN